MRHQVITLLLLPLSACSSSPDTPSPEAPAELGNPATLRASLAVVDTVFTADVPQSMGLLAHGQPVPVRGQGAPFLPDSLLGKTLTLDCGASSYAVSAQTGAPAQGVRFLLYQRTAAGSIACPPKVIAQLDLTDASRGDTTAARVTATPIGGGPAYFDYTIWHTSTDPQHATQATGFVNSARYHLSFHALSSPVTDGAADTTQLDDSAADIHETIHDVSDMGVDTYWYAFDLTFRHDTRTLRLQGTWNSFNARESWNETATINGQPFATVGGMANFDGGRPTFSPPFTGDVGQLLLDAVAAPSAHQADLGRLLYIGSLLVGVY